MVVIAGAHQAGKSTMLRNEFHNFAYLTIHYYDIMEMAQFDPQSLWRDKDYFSDASK